MGDNNRDRDTVERERTTIVETGATGAAAESSPWCF